MAIKAAGTIPTSRVTSRKLRLEKLRSCSSLSAAAMMARLVASLRSPREGYRVSARDPLCDREPGVRLFIL